MKFHDKKKISQNRSRVRLVAEKETGRLWVALTLMISDLNQTNRKIFNPLCSYCILCLSSSTVLRTLLPTIILLELAFTNIFHYFPFLVSCLMFFVFFFPHCTHLHFFYFYLWCFLTPDLFLFFLFWSSPVLFYFFFLFCFFSHPGNFPFVASFFASFTLGFCFLTSYYSAPLYLFLFLITLLLS